MAGALGGGLFLVALAVALLSALLPLLVRMRDGFHALLVASAVWVAPLMPTAAFMYRPDAFEAHEGLRDGLDARIAALARRHARPGSARPRWQSRCRSP